MLYLPLLLTPAGGHPHNVVLTFAFFTCWGSSSQCCTYLCFFHLLGVILSMLYLPLLFSPAGGVFLRLLMNEYHDCVQRAHRLSSVKENHLAGKGEVSITSVTMEDMLIYLRWLVCHLHAMKHFNQYLRVSWGEQSRWVEEDRCDRGGSSWGGGRGEGEMYRYRQNQHGKPADLPEVVHVSPAHLELLTLCPKVNRRGGMGWGSNDKR